MAHFVETNNADMLQTARAFEAELALCQGHLAEASRWARKFHAKLFISPEPLKKHLNHIYGKLNVTKSPRLRVSNLSAPLSPLAKLS